MKSIDLPKICFAVFTAVLFMLVPLESCNNAGATGVCEKRVVNDIVDCDDSKCKSPKRCTLQKRKKKTDNPWVDVSQPEENDPDFEFRCVCRG